MFKSKLKEANLALQEAVVTLTRQHAEAREDARLISQDHGTVKHENRMLAQRLEESRRAIGRFESVETARAQLERERDELLDRVKRQTELVNFYEARWTEDGKGALPMWSETTRRFQIPAVGREPYTEAELDLMSEEL